MSAIHDLLKKMAASETAFATTRFVAPCVAGGRVRARVSGIVQTFVPEPADFVGWGIFQVVEDRARLIAEADLPLVDTYLKSFPMLRLRLVQVLDGMTWLAYPVSEGDMVQRFGSARPVVLHLVTEGASFEQVTAHGVGGTFWFAEMDRRADPLPAEQLREAFREVRETTALAFRNLTPEMRAAYELASQANQVFQQQREERAAQEAREQRQRAERQYRADQRHNAWEETHPVGESTPPVRRRNRGRRHQYPAQGDEQRLDTALRTGGGHLRQFQDRGEYYLVEWTTANGEQHTSAIAKGDLTVISSGICLSGQDRDFDLQSLVGVIEQREW